MSNLDGCASDSESDLEECIGAEGGESPVTEAEKGFCGLTIHDKVR